MERAATADVSLLLGGVPIGVKELHQVAGWPDTDASLLFAERYADHDTTMVARLRAAGANLVGGLLLGIPVVASFARTGLVERLPSAVLATGLIVVGLLLWALGRILESVAAGRIEAKRLAYLRHH